MHVVYLEDSMVYNTSLFREIVIFVYIYFESIVGFLFIWELNIARSRKFVLLSQDLIKNLQFLETINPLCYHSLS